MKKRIFKLFLIFIIIWFFYLILFSDKTVIIEDERVPLSINPTKINKEEEINSLLISINLMRKKYDLEELILDEELCEFADIRSKELADKWSHERPNGQQGYSLIDSSKWGGENLAKNYFNAKDVLDGWCNSPTHLDNLLFKEYTKCGISIYQDNYGYSYWCIMFSS